MKIEIEHYPLTGRFYVLYKGEYIKKSVSTGICELVPPSLFCIATHSATEAQAVELAQLFKEQILKVNVTKKRIDL